MKILVIGCGSIGKRHAKNLLKFSEVYVYDQNTSLSTNFTEETGIESFATLEEALNTNPNGIIIATPTFAHTSTALKVIKSGAYILIEKPISHTFESAVKFLSEAKSVKNKIFVVCNMRFHQGVATLKTNLHKVGKPLFARAHVGNYLPNMRPGTDYRKLYCSNKSMGGGVILDAIHEIDYLIYLFGKISKVKSSFTKLSNLDIDVEDYSELNLTHNNKVRSNVHMDYLRFFKMRGCEIVGDKGMLLWESMGKTPEVCSVKFFSKEKEKWEILCLDKNLDPNNSYNELLRQFIKAINGEENLLLESELAVEEVRVVETLKID
jgi:predicted dehydrogenase